MIQFVCRPLWSRSSRLLLTGALLLGLGGAAETGVFAQQRHTMTETVVTNGFGNANISSLIGATAFYHAGYTGSSAIVANIEGGFYYRYHPDLSNNSIQLAYGGPTPMALGLDPNDPTQNAVHDPNLTNDPLWTQYDQHATAVAGVIASAPEYMGDPRAGIAYGATMVSGSIATRWINPPGSLSFDVTDQSFLTPYIQALQTGIPEKGGRLSNVVNGSYGFQDEEYSKGGTATSGADLYTVSFDGLARSSGATVVWAAGNNGYGVGQVNDPAAGYNGISVGATQYGNASAPYTTLAGFSSGGPSDFLSPTGTLIRGVRATVDIVAPGSSILTALYTGSTGGNLGAPPPGNPVPASYGSFTDGTSFAAPAVAGVATLLSDVGNTKYGGGNAVNGAVIKAVLLNSARPTDGWNNGQTLVNGVVTTTQALDYAAGAGYMDAGQAFSQYTAGTANVSNGQVMVAPAMVSQIGWDYGYLVPTSLIANPYNDYFIQPTLAGGSVFEGTLSWFVDRTFDGLQTATVDGVTTTFASASDLRFTNLNLSLWSVANGVPEQMVALSNASYISTQHFYFNLPSDGLYMLRVAWAGDQYNMNNSDAEGQFYGLAWYGTTAGSNAMPDASTILLFFCGAAVAIEARRRSLKKPEEPLG